ncbi:MAG TPA: ABC transporter permease, partial [Ideonella sp.]|nr:ABC transporter permease [Ideonella sp.]
MSATAAPLRGSPPGALRLWRLSWAEWRAHPWRQVAALVSVALGVALAFSVHLINASALAEFSSAVRAANGEPDLSLVSAQGGFDEALYDRVAQHPGVRVAHPRVAVDSVALLASGQRLPLRVLGIDALQVAAVAPELMPRPADAAARLAFLDPAQVFVNAALARDLGSAGTLTVVAQGRPLVLQVAGTVAAGGPALAVIDIAAAQQAFGFAGKLSRIDVRLAPGQRRDALWAELALPPDVRLQAPDDASQRVSNLSRAYRVNLTVLALVALVVGAFLVFSVVSLAVAQRTPGFALLGVLGMSAADRRTLVLAECGVTGAVASALGIALGTGMAAVALRLLAGDLGGGYFTGVAPPLRFSGPAALVFGA